MKLRALIKVCLGGEVFLGGVTIRPSVVCREGDCQPEAKLSKSEGGAVDEESLFTDIKKLMVRKSKLDDCTVEPSTMNVGTRKTRLAGIAAESAVRNGSSTQLKSKRESNASQKSSWTKSRLVTDAAEARSVFSKWPKNHLEVSQRYKLQ